MKVLIGLIYQLAVMNGHPIMLHDKACTAGPQGMDNAAFINWRVSFTFRIGHDKNVDKNIMMPVLGKVRLSEGKMGLTGLVLHRDRGWHRDPFLVIRNRIKGKHRIIYSTFFGPGRFYHIACI